ncbi:FAD-dependent monooxygenase [Streptomyces smyrnaeus]|uniref:FAD-dependent monooxygenase n=1 Tax=Streptomyces smyrnaeus TaxID=1387713 RepID=A0ABS3Y3Y5_9ACTN|nr:NAD(P)/FAD-dependent oxidoreductase [Streptomyces smyrnaeus]MBO8202321.1 FAD-dependent monooxygenase [Streptomyces smyrnaeus]
MARPAVEKPDITIVGGGLAGLSTGIALAESGIDTAIVESRRKAKADIFGFLLWPPGTRSLRWLGALPEALRHGAELESLTWFVVGQERTRLRVDLTELGAGTFLGILPSRLESVLRDTALRAGVRILDSVDEWTLSRERATWTMRLRRPEGPLTLRTPLLIGADGSGSRLRGELGLSSSRRQPRGQVIVTGVGGPLPARESRQALSASGSGGCVSLGDKDSWLYTVAQESEAGDPDHALRQYAAVDPANAPAYDQLQRAVVVRPWTITVPRWATDGAVLMGDAAHGMLPHLGLGGSLTLEDVPLLREVAEEAVRSGDFCAARLSAFQQRRQPRTAYAQRISDQWARVLCGSAPGARTARDLAMRRMARNMELAETFYRELASPSVPSLGTRMRMMML